MDEEKQPFLKYEKHNSSVIVHVSHGNQNSLSKPMPQTYGTHNNSHKTLVSSREPVTLTWENVNVYVNPPNKGTCYGRNEKVEPKQVLKNVYGLVKPACLLAIIGASGSGKTTLLNTLTSRSNKDILTTTGEIRVNGVDVGIGIRNISAYVQQDDLFIATMTVKEHLIFRALLRMDNRTSKQMRSQRVDEVIQELGLQKCQNNMIGNPGRIKGISGGEMRRLSFASEILTNPPLLFCDEPTSGLDSFMAHSIVQTLRTMADNGKTVLCTIHQPSSEVFSLFQHVLVMAEGRIAFMGETGKALEFYRQRGYPCPLNFNPADFYIWTMAVIPGQEEECLKRIETVCQDFQSTDDSRMMLDDIQTLRENPDCNGVIFEEAFSSTSRYEASWLQQFGAVFSRSWKTNIREPLVIRVKVMQTVVIAVILGLIYLQLDLSQEGVMNINGVLFLLITDATMSNLFSVLNLFPIEMPIFFREYNIGLYRVDIYFICKTLTELPFCIAIPILYCTIAYWMIGLYSSFKAFLVLTGVVVLVANIAVSFGYIVSASVNSVTTALAVAPPLMIPLMLFGGFFLNQNSAPVYFIWLQYLSWFKYSNELVSVNQWDNIDKISCANTSLPCLYENGQNVIEYLHFDKDNTWIDVGILLAMLVGYRMIAFFILLTRARRSKM